MFKKRTTAGVIKDYSRVTHAAFCSASCSASGAAENTPAATTRVVAKVPLALLENWKKRSNKMTLEDWVRLSKTLPVLLQSERLGLAEEVRALGDLRCALCKTSADRPAPLAWRRASDYQLMVCRACYLDRHGHQLKSAKWFPLMYRTFSTQNATPSVTPSNTPSAVALGVLSSGLPTAATAAVGISLETQENAPEDPRLCYLDSKEAENHPIHLLAYYEELVFKELMGNGFQYNSSYVSVLRAIAPQVALLMERVLPKLTLNTKEQMEEGVRHIVRTSSLFVYAKAANVL